MFIIDCDIAIGSKENSSVVATEQPFIFLP